MRTLLQIQCWLAFLCVSAAAFSLTPLRAPAASCARRHAFPLMQEDAPGDVEPEPSPAPEPEMEVEALGSEPVDVEPEPEAGAEPAVEEAPAASAFDDFEMEEGAIAKEALKAEIADGLAGAAPDRAVVGEILLALEAQNPTRSPATSALLNGKWKFLYASGASPGLKGLQLLLKGSKAAPKSPSGADLIDVQDTFLTIGPEQPRATAEVKVRVLSFENTIKLSSKLEAESAVRLLESYDAAESEYMSLKLPFSSTPVQYKRSMLVSYLDDEMLVLRDALGRPDVLMRVENVAWAPSSLDGDDTNEADDAPGAS
jgi:hypothetical protein